MRPYIETPRPVEPFNRHLLEVAGNLCSGMIVQNIDARTCRA